MTPVDRVHIIEQQEFEAQSKALLERALRRAQERRQTEERRIAEWIGRSQLAAARSTPAVGRKPKLYTHNGEQKTLTEWAIIADIPYHTLAARIRNGMDFGQALTKPHRGRHVAKLQTINGTSKTLQQWANELGITYNALSQRIHKLGSLEAVLKRHTDRKNDNDQTP